MATATLRFARMKPRKARLVADMVRGKSYQEACEILRFSPQHAAPILLNLIESAKSNAINIDSSLDEEDLVIQDIQVNDGPRMKRVLPRARGMASQILKRTAHITVAVGEPEA